MSKKLTMITEISTGLGMIPSNSLESLLSKEKPECLNGVTADAWEQIQEWWAERDDVQVFESCYETGRYFFESDYGLRGRAPFVIEWKGPDLPPEDFAIPADLRVDHVYIVSCKNQSKVLANPSPATLFTTALRNNDAAGRDWYESIAPVEYHSLLESVKSHFGLGDYPDSPIDLQRSQRAELKKLMNRAWPSEVMPEVELFNEAVSVESAKILRQVLTSTREQERFYWRLLRLHSSPYFMLGWQGSRPLRLMVLTPWDLRRQYAFRSLTVEPDHAGQPQVRWEAHLTDLTSGEDKLSRGHFEIRWSHGKFCGAPESKIYLDTPHVEVSGYLPI
jgi:hypothetical protein